MFNRIIIFVELVIVGFGFYNEISAGIEKSLPFTYLSKSQGLSLAIISFTMSLVLIALEKEREGRKMRIVLIC